MQGIIWPLRPWHSFNHPRLAYPVLLSLILTLTSCQTLSDGQNASNKEQVRDLIETKITIVKNLLDKGQAEEAWQNLRPMLQAYPKHATVVNMAGLNHLALSNPQRALALFKQAYRLKASTAIGLNLSSALITTGATAAARRVLLRLFALREAYPYKERLWHNLALTYDKEKQLGRAEKFYRKALAENPSYYLSNLQLAHLYKRRMATGMAMKHYEKAAANCQSCFIPTGELANHYINSGQTARAIRLLRSFIHKKDLPAVEKRQAQDLLRLASRVNRHG